MWNLGDSGEQQLSETQCTSITQWIFTSITLTSPLALGSLAPHLLLAVMPPRHYPPAVSNDVVLTLFDSPHVHLKASHVVRLLQFKRSKRRIVCAQLRRLARIGRLVEHPTLSTRYTQPLYGLPELLPLLIRLQQTILSASVVKPLLPLWSAYHVATNAVVPSAGSR